MDNNNPVMETVEVKPEKKGGAGRVVHLTAAIIVLAAAIVFVVLSMILAIDFVQLKSAHDALEDTSAQIGSGLSQAIAVVFCLIFGVIGGALSAISVVLSSTVWRFRKGGHRVFGMISTLVSIALILTVVGSILTVALV